MLTQIRKIIKQPYVNLMLLGLTLITTYYARGIWYSLAVVLILLAHEMGHFLVCRKYHIPATFPFFIPIPAPFNPFGTMGAVIKMEGKIPHRKALFDIGVAGPLAGLVLTVITLIIGLTIPIPSQQENLRLGSSLIFKLLARCFNPGLLNHPNGFINPVIFAGWVGLFVTALNLLPIGQLDGGHIIYAMIGAKSKYFYRVGILALAINTAFYPPWVVFLILLITFGMRHPAPIDDNQPIGWKRQLIGIFTFLIFITSFMPFPFRIF
jgi:membrane-associated protease RseP (regulator of RpoE activity)